MKAFGKWETSDMEFRDRGMARYINVEPIWAPSGSGPADERFRDDVSIIDRLVNKLMRGQNTGKKTKMFNAMEEALEKVEDRAGENPVQMLVRAVENSGPREETVRLKYGGIAVQKPVDSSPQRRVNLALKLLSDAVRDRSHKSPGDLPEVLADELIKAANGDMDSYAVKRKVETERVASAAR